MKSTAKLVLILAGVAALVLGARPDARTATPTPAAAATWQG